MVWVTVVWWGAGPIGGEEEGPSDDPGEGRPYNTGLVFSSEVSFLLVNLICASVRVDDD